MGKQINISFNTDVSAGKKGSLYLLKLTNEVSYPDSTIREFRDLVEESEDLYPGIGEWFGKKVQPGINDGSRYAFLVMHKGKSIAEAIVKRGTDAKLCSLRIREKFQNQAIGPILFNEVANTLSRKTKQIHFTAPESLVYEREDLFNILGFINKGKVKRKYRSGNDEFAFEANTMNFISKTSSLYTTLFENPQEPINNSPIVMSIHPKHLLKILNGEKNIELRRLFSNKLVGTTIFLYATSPVKKVVGEANVSLVIEESPKFIWNNYNTQLGCTYEDLKKYSLGKKKINAIVLDNIVRYHQPISWDVFTTAFGAPMKPPQNYSFLTPFGFNSSILEHNVIIPSLDPQKRKSQLSLFEW
jgi:predicted transcriptional regulator